MYIDILYNKYLLIKNIKWYEHLYKEGRNIISKPANKIPFMNAMANMHDSWSSTSITGTTPILQITIAPAVYIQYCAVFPSLCGVITTEAYDINKYMNDNKKMDFGSTFNNYYETFIKND